jgi:hypothetical protein
MANIDGEGVWGLMAVADNPLRKTLTVFVNNTFREYERLCKKQARRARE